MESTVMKAVESKKAKEEVWKDCTDFLPDDFDKILASLHTDSTSRLKRLKVL